MAGVVKLVKCCGEPMVVKAAGAMNNDYGYGEIAVVVQCGTCGKFRRIDLESEDE